MTGEDPWGEVAALIAEAARSAEDARRYRALADTIAAPCFERALALGSEVRRAARQGATASAAAFVAELQELTARSRTAIAEVRSSSIYQEATSAYAAGDSARTADLACELFADVGVHPNPAALYWMVALGGRRASDHFLPASELAVRIEQCRREGVRAEPTPPSRGGDEAILPVQLSEQHDPSESPVALVFEPAMLPGPVCQLLGSEPVFFYASRLAAEFSVSCAPSVDDEWWKIRPDAYQAYLDELREALLTRAIRVLIEPRPAEPL